MAALVDRLRETLCDREPFTPDHAKCVCRLTNEAADEIERLSATLKEAFAAIGVANCINTVRSEFDFEPVYQRIKSALEKP